MFIRPRYSLLDLMSWTRRESVVFVLVAAAPVVVYDVFDQRWLHLPWLPIALVGTAVAFIVGFQNNATYGRLWEARKIWGGITNVSRAWGIEVNDFLTNDFTDAPVSEADLAQERRTLVKRHVAWLTSLRHALRQPRPWEVLLREQTNREWARRIRIREHELSVEEELGDHLDQDERAYVCARTNRAAHVISLQSKHLRRLRTRGLIEDFRHMELQGLLVEMLALQGKAERIKNFPYPRQYATLNSVFLWVFVLLLPFGVMREFDELGGELAERFPRLGEGFVWASIPFSIVVMWIFHTMERIGRVSENPFEGSPNDVPITTMARAIEIDLLEMIDEPREAIPAPIEPIHHTQT